MPFAADSLPAALERVRFVMKGGKVVKDKLTARGVAVGRSSK